MIMDFFMKPGTKIKRWIFLGLIGMILSVIGIVEIFSKHEHNLSIKLLYLFLTFIGLVMIYISVSEFIKSLVAMDKENKLSEYIWNGISVFNEIYENEMKLTI